MRKNRQYIELLEKEKSLMKRKEYNKLIQQYNDLGKSLYKEPFDTDLPFTVISSSNFQT